MKLPESLRAGFSLVELLVAIAMLAILMAIAAPSMDQIARQSKLDADTERLQSSLAFARSEAVKRSSVVSIVPVAGRYESGWRITTDHATNNPDCTLSGADGEQLLREQDALSRTTSIAIARTIDDGVSVNCDDAAVAPNACISFSARGVAISIDGAVLTQVMCVRDSLTPSTLYRAVAITRSGQSYLVKVKN